ncbi:hypothetical protein HAZT_HAZT010890 [Hyalella azteca]|uniref:Nuclear pore complex protein Nup50-like n=1 Tax=Hyalella azteca TaxID=294128 RepID=A0A6A0H0H3_HYAAZ|nr:nuclear pore complex protein Nup50-like [Hyalella azteca]KAA0195160.1 hypothetical protein HAZT_HAZT010890 [Hyalella azteca]
MAKRPAGSDLNRDNWDQDDEPEQQAFGDGAFQRASEEELARRKIKVAKRRSDLVTSDGSDKPSVFKNFSGFSGMTNASSSATTFDFGAKSSSEPKSEMKKLFEASSFKPSTSIGSSTLPTFSFSSSTSNKENSKPLESNSTSVNGSASSSELLKKLSGSEGDSNKVFHEKLKLLNEGVLQWVHKHVTANCLINLNPVFDDYRKHFDALEKQFMPKFEKSASTSSASSSTVVSSASSSPSLSSTNVTSPKNANEAAFSVTDSVKPVFSFGGGTDLKPKENPVPGKVDVSKPAFSFMSSTSTNSVPSVTFSESKDKNVRTLDPKQSFPEGVTSGLFCFGAAVAPKSGSGSGGFSLGSGMNFGAKENTGFSFGGGALSSGAKEGSGFSGFGSKSALTFAPVPPIASDSKTEEDEEETPPKPEVLEVKEENSFYEKKCKLFYKKDGSYADRGVGTLFLKTVGDTKKTQLIMRAATALGNVLLNIVLNSSLPTQRMGKNNVLIVCVPNPPLDNKEGTDKPVTMLIRVKTSEDADELFKQINDHKGD